jgi:hypothetical protein
MSPLDIWWWWPETVSGIEAIWLPSSLMPLFFALPAATLCWQSWRGLDGPKDGGARRVAFMLWIVCVIICVKALINISVAIPTLFIGPPVDDGAAVDSALWFARTVSPIGLVINNILLSIEAVVIGRSIGAVAYPRKTTERSHEMRRSTDTLQRDGDPG